jgi:hypothetical protein
MTPPAGKTGEPKGLIFIIGAYCDQKGYEGHLRAIQEKVDFPLYVAIPHFVGDLPIPVGLGVYIDSAKGDLKKNHNLDLSKFYFGGHSMGGSSIASWAHSNIDQVEGVFVMGAYAANSIEDPANNYGAPFLTVGAQFDGWMARVTRIAKSYD